MNDAKVRLSSFDHKIGSIAWYHTPLILPLLERRQFFKRSTVFFGRDDWPPTDAMLGAVPGHAWNVWLETADFTISRTDFQHMDTS